MKQSFIFLEANICHSFVFSVSGQDEYNQLHTAQACRQLRFPRPSLDLPGEESWEWDGRVFADGTLPQSRQMHRGPRYPVH